MFMIHPLLREISVYQTGHRFLNCSIAGVRQLETDGTGFSKQELKTDMPNFGRPLESRR